MTEKRFESLESKLAFQEDVIQKLDDVLIDQQQQIQALSRQVKNLTVQLKGFEAQLPEGPESPPPHY